MKRQLLHGFTVGALAVAMVLPAPKIHAQAIRTSLGLTHSLAGNDDGSTGLVPFGFNFNLFGTTYSGAYLNNNGNITFNAQLGEYTPFPIVQNGIPMLAPFFGDVDTRTGNLMTYGTTTVGANNAFAVNWDGVGYYGRHTDKLNYFQLVMIDRTDLGAGNFDFEFNYNNMAWETGDASGGSGGLGGSCARMGWTNGTTSSYEQPGSGVCGAFLDGGVDALNSHSLNSNVAGRYLWSVRGGSIVDTSVPEPSTFALLVPGLVGLAGVIRRRRLV